MGHQAKKWKRLESKVILDTDRLKVVADKVLLPNGKKSDYIRLAPVEAHSVIMIAINNKSEVLVQKEYSYPPDKIMWQLPGGSMEAGESIKQAALRELAEESGFSAKKIDQIGEFYTINRLSDQKQYVIVCTDLFEHKLPHDENEFIDTFWLSRQNLEDKIANGEFDNINLLAALNIWFTKQA